MLRNITQSLLKSSISWDGKYIKIRGYMAKESSQIVVLRPAS